MFTYNGTEATVYNDITFEGSTLVAEPGKSYELDAAPDENWSSSASPKASQKAPEAPVEASDSTPTTN